MNYTFHILSINHLIVSYPVPTTLFLNYCSTVAITTFNSTNPHMDSLISGIATVFVGWNMVLYYYNKLAPEHTRGSSPDTSIRFFITLLFYDQGSLYYNIPYQYQDTTVLDWKRSTKWVMSISIEDLENIYGQEWRRKHNRI